MKGAIGGLVVVAIGLVAFLLYFNSNSPEDSEEVTGEVTSNSVEAAKKDVPQIKEKSDEEEDDPEWEGYDKEKAREVMRDEGMPVGASSFTGPRPLTEKEMDKMDEIFESYEKGWDAEMKTLMVSEIGLTEEDYGDYLKMRDGFEEDRLEAFEEFHKKMAMERGPHYSYSPTQEMIDFDKKLKDEYLDLFRKRYGEEAYARYMNTLDKYNSKIRSEADPKFGVLTIEF